MITQATEKPSATSLVMTQSSAWAKWPALVFAIGVLVLYFPTLVDAAHQWMINDNYAHGIFIFPLCGFLIWLRRDDLRLAERRPTAWGLIPLIIGLLLQCGSYTLQIKYVGMWSLFLTVTGGILILYGLEVWRIARFAVLFSLLANPLPHSLLNNMTIWIQGASTSGAATLMSLLGFTLIRTGNVIHVPGADLEVAQACSGFHKFLSLTAFTLLYSYLFTTRKRVRIIILLAVLPIALLVNILRISGLIAFASLGGLNAMHAAHDGAEYCAIILAFGLLVLLGRSLGCRTIRFSL